MRNLNIIGGLDVPNHSTFSDVPVVGEQKYRAFVFCGQVFLRIGEGGEARCANTGKIEHFSPECPVEILFSKENGEKDPFLMAFEDLEFNQDFVWIDEQPWGEEGLCRRIDEGFVCKNGILWNQYTGDDAKENQWDFSSKVRVIPRSIVIHKNLREHVEVNDESAILRGCHVGQTISVNREIAVLLIQQLACWISSLDKK